MKGGPMRPILLVEDNEDDVFALKRAFKQEKIENPLLVVNNGQSAIDYLSGSGFFADRARFPLPFIVFLDLKLPYVSGFDVLAWIRGQPELTALIVVVLTSSDETRDYKRAYALGARSYITKSGTTEELEKFLRSLQSWARSPESGPVLIKFAAQAI
jgi:CheY-like chemotaxis protein